MENCKNCKPIRTKFDTIGKTYYLLVNEDPTADKEILCFRHWYQADRPEYIMSGDHTSVILALKNKTPQHEKIS